MLKKTESFKNEFNDFKSDHEMSKKGLNSLNNAFNYYFKKGLNSLNNAFNYY